MLQLNINLPELRNFAKEIPSIKDGIFQLMRMNIKETAQEFLNGLMNCEFEVFLGRCKYERQGLIHIGERNYRNGHYGRTFAIKGIGQVRVSIPRDRNGKFKSAVIPKYQQMETAIKEDIAVLYLTGMSTRSLKLVSKRLFGTEISAQMVSQCSGKLKESVEAWRTRSLTEKYKYLYLDGTNFSMRIDKKVEKVCVLVVIGVTESGHKEVLALQAGDKESASTWREVFKDLKERGLDKDAIKLGIMDGLSGLEKVFSSEFPEAKIQRCQVHVARNVLTKIPHSIKLKVADDLRSIFYSSTKKKAMEFFTAFKSRWQKDIPSAVGCLESSLDRTLCYLSFPENEWLALRTTNPIERLNKEFKRRTKTMEIVAGEASCYNLLAVISLRMETYWKRHPITFQTALPWFKQNEFTQKN